MCGLRCLRNRVVEDGSTNGFVVGFQGFSVLSALYFQRWLWHFLSGSRSVICCISSKDFLAEMTVLHLVACFTRLWRDFLYFGFKGSTASSIIKFSSRNHFVKNFHHICKLFVDLITAFPLLTFSKKKSLFIRRHGLLQNRIVFSILHSHASLEYRT